MMALIYQGLNSHVIEDAYPLPGISEMLEALHVVTIFPLELRSKY